MTSDTQYKNIVLIGMPGTGKTTIGTLLADMLSYGFVDTDQVITDKTGKTPRQIVEETGRESFLKTQDECVLALDCTNSVIATGGGLVHSDVAMKHLKAMGVIIFLDTSYEIIAERMDVSRKLVRTNGNLRDLYNERVPLYKRYADAVVSCDNTEPRLICERIQAELPGKCIIKEKG